METELDWDPGQRQHGNANNQTIVLDTGKHMAAIALCAAICGVSVVLSVWAAVEARAAATEYRVLLNHTMELEAKQKAMEDSYERR